LQTFGEIARTYDVYVVLSTDLARAQRSREPEAVAALADPDLDDVMEVWVATEAETYNFGIWIDPDGNEIARVPKTYLTRDEEGLLGITHGALRGIRPVDLGFARTGMVISKDAWMPDVLARLDAQGVDLMLQPEAFGGWAVEQYAGDWLPDVFKQSSWAHVQRYASPRYNVTPCIKGNLLSLPFDCQSHIVGDARATAPHDGLIGQVSAPGWLAIEPWVMTEPAGDLDERRAALRARGLRMLPGSGDPLEDAYENRVVAADLALDPGGRHPVLGDGDPGVWGPSRIVLAPRTADDAAVHQRAPAIAAEGERVFVALAEGDPAGGEVRVARSIDGGATFSAMDLPAPPGGARGRIPAVAMAGDRVLIAFEEVDVSTTFERVVGVVSTDGGGSWRRVEIAGTVDAPAWAPDVAVDGETGRLHVAWLDLRHGGRAKPYVAWSDDGVAWASLQVDPSNDVVANPRGNAGEVQVAAAGGITYVAYNDFRAQSWDVYVARSEDGGETFADAARINSPARIAAPASGGSEVELERLHADLRLALDPQGIPLVAHGNLQDRRPETWAVVARGNETIRVDDAPPWRDAFRPDLAVRDDGTWVLVWQDHRTGANRMRTAERPPDEDPRPSAVVDDAAPDAHAFRPRIALVGVAQAPIVVWEDYRHGTAVARIVKRP
jgi:predicted amidohydrolase